MHAGWFNRVVPFRKVLFNWTLVYIGNWAGTLLTAYFLGYLTNLFDYQQYRIYLNELVIGKLEVPSASPFDTDARS
jgi:formate transporter